MRWLLYLLLLPFVVYGAAQSIPVRWTHFDVHYVEVESGSGGNRPVLFQTHIKRAFLGEYSVIIREVGTGEIVCDAHGGPITYKPNSGPHRQKDLAWWAPSDPRCSNLPPGTYFMKTNWRLIQPFGRFFGERYVVEETPPFTVE